MAICTFLEMLDEQGEFCTALEYRTAPCFLDPPWCPLEQVDELFEIEREKGGESWN